VREKFPVFFPVSREFLAEKSSQSTASTATENRLKNCFSAHFSRTCITLSVLWFFRRNQTSTFRENSLPSVNDVPLRGPRVRIDCAQRQNAPRRK
jgi:hypothetical protein